MNKTKLKNQVKERRRGRVRAKVKGSAQRPRLNIFCSNKGFYLQIINDEKGITLVSAHIKEIKDKDKLKRIEQAKVLGELIAQKAIDKKIKKVVFDRSHYKYHGRVKAIADGARSKGLEF